MNRNTIQLNKNNSFFILFFGALLVAVSDFMQLGMYMLLGLSVGYLALGYRTVKIPQAVILIALFAWTYFLFCLPHTPMQTAFKVFVCPLLWLVGYNLPHNRNVQSILKVASLLAFGMAIHGIANYAYNLYTGVAFSKGVTYDIWSRSVSAVTGQMMNFALFISLLPWLILIQPNKWIRLIYFLVFVSATTYAILLGSRTYVVLCMLVAVIAVVAVLLEKNQDRKEKRRKLVWLIFGISLVLLYFVKSSSFSAVYEESYMASRIGRNANLFRNIMDENRFMYKKLYLQSLFVFPWGGKYIGEIVGNYAHDLWLDIFNEAGVVAFVAIIGYTLTALKRLLNVRKRPEVSANEKIAILTYTIIIFAEFFVEPIWQGGPLLLCCFVLIDGMIAKFLALKNLEYNQDFR